MPRKPMKMVRNPGDIVQQEHADGACAKRVIQGGTIAAVDSAGDPIIIASIIAATLIGQDEQVLVTNDTAGTVYVAVGDATVAAPTSATGIAIPAGSQLVIAMGANAYIRASAAVQAVVLAQ